MKPRSLIAYAVLLALFICALVVVPSACKTTPPDPDNGVSNASYRLVVTRSLNNLDALLVRMQTAEEEDITSAKPVHSKDWWDAQIGVVSATATLLAATLKGATYTASPQ